MKTVNLKKQPTLGLAIIVKDCGESLKKLLDSAKLVGFDEIVVTDTGSASPTTLEAATAYGAKCFKWEDPDPAFLAKNGFISDFAAARQFSFNQSTTDYVMWVDADDVIVEPQNLKPKFLESVSRNADSAIAMSYYYSKDKRGNWNTITKRIRIVRKQDFHWEGEVHEDILADKSVKFWSILPGDCRIEHDIEAKDGSSKNRDLRNLTILENVLQKKGDLDPRLWKHLGQSYEAFQRFSDAIKCYQTAMSRSSWIEDIYMNLCNIGGCFRQMGLPHEALKYDKEATDTCPQYPNAWTFLAMDHNLLKNFKKAIFYTDIAMSCKEVSDTLGLNPSGLRCALYVARHMAFRELGRTQEALTALKEIDLEYPDPTEWKHNVALFEKALHDAETYRAHRRLQEEIAKEGNREKFDKLLAAAPAAILDYPDFQFLKKKVLPYDKPTMAIVCPGEGWGVKSLETGIGGSEEAVIFLAKELAKQGVWVDVFTNTPWPGEHEGVNWYPFHAMRPSQDYYDHVVIWRYTDLIDEPWNCGQLSVWCHDVQFQNQWSEKRINKVDKVIFLSKFHREGAPWIPENKVLYSRNGLSPEYFAEPQNDPMRVCYTSNPTRGLLQVLKMWPEIRKETGATLHTYYGFTELTKRALTERPIEAREMYEIQTLMASMEGIVNHGMIGQKELSQETAKAGIWFYPTRFPEVSCISAMRAQAMGAIPICSDFAALKETVFTGVGVEMSLQMEEISKSELIKLINDPMRQSNIRGPMVASARVRFPWSGVAEQWIKELGVKTWKTPTETSPRLALVET